VLIAIEGGVMVVTLNRPEARNAMNRALVDGLREALAAAGADASVHAVVLTGAGSVFCAGADLRELQTGESPEDRVDASIAMYSAFSELPVPVIAAVNGHAVAGGCGLAMVADFVVCAEDASLWYPEVERGLIPAIVAVRLSQLVGPRLALELLLGGRRLSAPDALRLGLVNEVVARDVVVPTALGLGRTFASRDRDVVRATKRLFYDIQGRPAAEGLRLARAVAVEMRRASRS
jgi:enoyl-CoA hydratase/carnithine racemase